MEKIRELYSMARFFTALFAVLALGGFWVGATGYDGSDSAPGMVMVGALFGVLFSLTLGAALGLRDNLKGMKS